MAIPTLRFVIITPVRDEEQFVQTTLECMIAQTLKPVLWVIVDDGSSDRTAEIINQFIKKYSYIKFIHRQNRGKRLPGKGVVEAFYDGYELANNYGYDIIAKMDGDLDFPPDTLERLAHAFHSNPHLGITGAKIMEQTHSGALFKPRVVPPDYVGGSFKFYHKECFAQIGGLILRAGWDGVDTIHAAMKGWESWENQDIVICHLKPTGLSKGEGLRKACMKYGDVSYYMGGYVWYFLLRAISRSVLVYNPLVGAYMITGYLNSMISIREREATAFRNFLKRRQWERLRYWFKRIWNKKRAAL